MALELPVVGLVLLAALLHAGWNTLLKASADGLLTYALLCLGAGALGGALLVFVPFPATASWPYLLVSGTIHVAYFTALLGAYRFGDLSHVYPLARGASPLVVSLGAMLFAGEVPGLTAAAGVALASLGIASLAFGGGGRIDPRPILYALATAVTIGAYTVIDGIGVRLSGSAFGYAAAYFIITGLSVPPIAVIARGAGPALSFARAHWARGVAGGAMVAGAYGLVLWALAAGAMAQVSALRETSVIMAALMGTLFLGEPFGRRRVAAAIVVAAGLVLLNLAA